MPLGSKLYCPLANKPDFLEESHWGHRDRQGSHQHHVYLLDCPIHALCNFTSKEINKG